MRTPILLSTIITSFALAACGGSSEPAKSPDADQAAEKSAESAEKAEDKADKAADKANDAAADADKAQKENEAK